MADYSPYRITLLATDYPARYDAFVTAAQTVATEQETAREGQASLVVNIQRRIRADVGLTQDLNANGLKITNVGTPGSGGDAVNKTYADNLSFSSALPAQAGNAGLVPRTDGASTIWDNWWGSNFPLTSAATLVDRRSYNADSSGGAFSVNLPAQTAKSWLLIRDVGRMCATNNITLVPNGTDKVYGSVQNYIMDMNGENLLLVVDATKGWVRG